MKKIITSFYKSLSIILLTAMITASCTGPESSTAVAAVEKIPVADAPNSWVFNAQQTIPDYGRSRQETGGYTVSCNPGKLVVYLPYIGRADAAANTSTDKSPLDFTSTNFSIDRQEKKPGEWHITISPKDYSEVRTMHFIFYDNGSANLDIVLTGRTGISFRGLVEGLK